MGRTQLVVVEALQHEKGKPGYQHFGRCVMWGMSQ